MAIRCLIVDDEISAQEILSDYINECPELIIEGVCNNAIEANEKIQNSNIDLIFLDINMPKLSGMKFYKNLVNPPQVIFTTAYPQFAIEGFEVDAIDYLLKPFAFERFLKAINKAGDVLKASEKAQTGHITLVSNKQTHRVDIRNIILIQALGDYVVVQLSDKKLTVHDTLGKMLSKLPEDMFIQTHKSFIVSLNKIDYIEGNTIKSKNFEIPIGQKFKKEVMNKYQ